ncbi:anti-sigma F factor [Anaerotignum faecicola]|nr:anti-sigma F factor [Anaerotignum faecicola]
MDFENEMTLNFKSKSQNEGFARLAIAGFIMELDPTITEINDIKTAVSEAVTNAIIHGYERKDGVVTLHCAYSGKTIYIDIIDKGRGIENVDEAMEPLFTSKPQEERSGLGFTVMESFMDEVKVESILGAGTKVSMVKTLKSL